MIASLFSAALHIAPTPAPPKRLDYHQSYRGAGSFERHQRDIRADIAAARKANK